jgi:nuclear pore complex protein Nup133
VRWLTRFLVRNLDEHYRPVKPSECLGAFTYDVDARFSNMDKSFKDKLIDAMRWEDAQLRKYVDKHQLDRLALATIQLAERAIHRAVDEATAEGAALANGTNGAANGNGSAKA